MLFSFVSMLITNTLMFLLITLFYLEYGDSNFGNSVSANNNVNRIAIWSPNSSLRTDNITSSVHFDVNDIVERSFFETNCKWTPIGQHSCGEKSIENSSPIVSLNNNGNMSAISSPGANTMRVCEFSNENWVHLGFNFQENDDDNANYDDDMSLSLDGNKLFSDSPQDSSDIVNNVSRHNNSNLGGKTRVCNLNQLTDVSTS